MAEDKKKNPGTGTKNKKRKPRDQDSELRRANWEFFKRNKDEVAFMKKRYELLSPVYKEVNTFKKFVLSIGRPAAVTAGSGFSRGLLKASHSSLTPEKKRTQYRKNVFSNKDKILSEMLQYYPDPSECLILLCDRTRTKEAIMADVEKQLGIFFEREKSEVDWNSTTPLEIVKKDIIEHGNGVERVRLDTPDGKPYTLKKIAPIPQVRLKWLSNLDELLEVWDAYEHAGQQATRTTINQIALDIGRPVNTVKDQWRSAYEKIKGKQYDPESKISTEEKKREAELLCATCPDAKCYKKDNYEKSSTSWYPCADYLKISGKDRELNTSMYIEGKMYENDDKYE